MTQGIQLRNAESGVVLGSEDYPVDDQQVMVFDAATQLWFPRPYTSGGGGSITPLTGVAVADQNGTALTPDGSFSGDKAFNGLNALQDCVDALAGTAGGGIWLAPGDYSGDDAPVELIDISVTINGLGFSGAAADPPAARLDGSIVLTSTDASADLGLVSVVQGCTIDDGGSGGNVSMRRCNGVGSIDIAGTLSVIDCFMQGPLAAAVLDITDCQVNGVPTVGTLNANNCDFASAVTCTGCALNGCTFESTFGSSGTINADGCTFLSDATQGGVGTSTVRDSTFVGNTQFDKVIAYDSTFQVVAGGTDPRSMQFYNCVITSQVNSPCAVDAATERESLLVGCVFAASIGALSIGQGGDALAISESESHDFTAETRLVVCPGTLAGDIAINIEATGGKNLQKFFIDNWSQAHTITVTTNGGDDLLVTIAPQVAGGARYTFGITEGDVSVVVYTDTESL